MVPTVSLLGLTIQTYTLTLLLAVWVGLWLSEREAQRLGIDRDSIYNLGLSTLLATLLSARTVYVVSHWSAYQDDLFSILSPAPTALAWSEGALIGIVVALIYWYRRQLPMGITLDALAPGLALALTLERLGDLFGGSSFGSPTTLPWGMYSWGEVRHPIQFYEMAALLVVLGILWWRRKHRPFDGHSFVLFVALYAGLRLFLEAFHARTPLMANGIRTVQVVALIVTLCATGYLYRRRFSVPEDVSGAEQEHEI